MNEMQISRSNAISFRQLRLFESVGRLSSVRRGSEECNLSQPAVTQALAKLEKLVGIQLFERRASGSYLTEAGTILHSRVNRMFAQLASALFDLDVPGGQAGAVAVAHRLSRSQVRSLVAIIDHGSFALAARALDLTHASLQRSARDLEANLRKPIYFRSSVGVMVTPEGIEFGRRIKLALQEIDWAINEIEVAQGYGESRIVIGALPFGGSVLLASVLDEFLAGQPNVDVRIINESATAMIRALRAGEVDLVVGLTQEASGDDLVSRTLIETPYEVVARAGHPLASKGQVAAEDLAAYDWAIGAEGSNRRSCFDSLFAGTLPPKTPITTSSLPVIRHLLEVSDRLTLMTSYELQHEEVLTRIPFRHSLPSPAIGITTRANWLPTPLHRNFVGLLEARSTALDRIAA